MSDQLDPVYKHAKREAVIIGVVWLSAMLYCCFYSYFFGYSTPEHPLGPGDLKSILGMPSWVFWGYMVPWGVCAIFTFWFAGFYMADDDLGSDHASELEADIRERGLSS